MLEQVAAVSRMQDYIEQHLHQKITLTGLAEASLFSPWHAYRLFRKYTGLTPADYCRRLRLSQSAMRLKTEKCQVIDVAYDSGFSSVDGYTRAFYKEFGCNPGEYVKNPVPIKLFVPYGVKFKQCRKEIINMENLQTVFIQKIQKPKRNVIIKRGVQAKEYFAYCEEVSCDVWGTLLSMDSLIGEPVCMWLPNAYQKANTSQYVQGVEVLAHNTGKIPDGFDLISLPEAEYLVFQGEPFLEEDYASAILSLEHAIDHYDPTIIGYEWDDDNPRIQLEPRGERGYIELRAIKKGNSMK